MPEQLSISDLALLQKANEAMRQANTLMRFVHDHLEEFYKLDPKDRVDHSTGAITRVTEQS